jgi:hypothetical protein
VILQAAFEGQLSTAVAGLPVGFFSNQKSQFGYILEGPAMEDVGKILLRFGPFSGHLAYFMAI